jgi:pimeloyl-ACP methyl ester carboxylesterase
MDILHAQVLGKGYPLIILHEYLGMGDNSRSLGLKLADAYEVHIVDQRNHGRSFHHDAFDYELLVEDLYHYVQHHGFQEVALIGHSMGGKVAMLYAVTFPELVSKLVVADIAPKYYQPHHQEVLAALNAVNFDLHDTRQKVEEVMKLHVSDAHLLQFLLKNVYRIGKDRLAFRCNVNSLTLNNVEVGEPLPSYTTYDGPALFLKGEHSDYILEEDEALIDEHFPNARIQTVKNAGHWIHSDNPAGFHDEVDRFLHPL